MDKILEMIDILQRSEFGDLAKLTRIKNRINDGYILQDDIDYVDQMYNEFTNSRGGAIKKPSKAWYLLPIFFWILGGIVSYVCLRKRDPGRARNTLILGSVFFGMFIALVLVGSTIPDVSTTDSTISDVDVDNINSTNSTHYDQVESTNPTILPISKVLEPQVHKISYDTIPEYVDSEIVITAIDNAIQFWESDNPHLDLQLVDSDSDLELTWSKWMPSSTLGVYRTFNSTINGMTISNHEITIRMGNDDCHSDYQPYNVESLTHTIAHELGHYLGLRHIDARGHLMYSGELFDVDSILVYDDQGYTIPKISKPTVRTLTAQNILEQTDSINRELDQIIKERQVIKDQLVNRESNTLQSDLESNSKKYNELAQHLEEFDKQLSCIEID